MVLVTKYDGTTQQFDKKKLIRSLQRSGATSDTIHLVLAKVANVMYPKIPTKKIFSIAYKEFRRVQPVISSKYDLKNALMRLGRSGFPFEAFIERVLTAEGFDCHRNYLAQGKIIPHEIDVVAKKGSEVRMVECKHRSKPWITIHIQTSLYVYARFLDVNKEFTRPMIATNTKFTPQVLKYAKGIGMELLGWRFPKNASLERLIERHKMYPITMLRSISPEMLEKCLKKDVILLSDIHPLNEAQLKKKFGIDTKKARKILLECQVCAK
jgi:Holliday junction resolvase